MKQAVLHSSALSVGYGSTVLLDKIDLDLYAGELVAMIGVNGIGKSTLLRTLAGLKTPLNGTVKVNSDDVHKLAALPRSKRISAVLTGRPDMGMLDVRTLISLGRQPWTGRMGGLSHTDEVRIAQAMQSTGTDRFESRSLGSLSDGELQLVLIARAMAQDTPVMLLDEPTAFLDLVNRVRITALLKDVAYSTNKLVLLSTHDLHTAMEMTDRILLVTKRQVVLGTPKEMIASGALEKAFSHRDPSGKQHQFDAATLSFRMY